jgi:hypothetical protein
VRHGQMLKDQSIVFRDICGLRHKKNVEPELPLKKTKSRIKTPPVGAPKAALKLEIEIPCIHVPFPEHFDYFSCQVYQENFASQGLKNGVLPTKDFQYSEHLSGLSLTDMELL